MMKFIWFIWLCIFLTYRIHFILHFSPFGIWKRKLIWIIQHDHLVCGGLCTLTFWICTWHAYTCIASQFLNPAGRKKEWQESWRKTDIFQIMFTNSVNKMVHDFKNTIDTWTHGRSCLRFLCQASIGPWHLSLRGLWLQDSYHWGWGGPWHLKVKTTAWLVGLEKWTANMCEEHVFFWC